MNTKTVIRVGLLMCCALVMMLTVPSIHAGTLNTDVIGMFPSTAGEFAYADLRLARQFPWFGQLKEQMLPSKFRTFEQFLAAAGMDPNVQVEEVAWALVPTTLSGGGTSVPTSDQIVGVALGQFQPSAVQTYFKTRKLPTTNYRGSTLYSFGSATSSDTIYFAFIDPNTVVFGQKNLVEQIIAVRFGAQANLLQNATLYSLIQQANGHGIVWAVMNPAYTRLALAQLIPQTSQFPQATQLLAGIQSLLISVQASTGIEADFQATCPTSSDATNMAALIQAAIMFQRYQATQNNPSLATMLDTAVASPSGNRVAISLTLTNDQMTALIQSKTFAAQN